MASQPIAVDMKDVFQKDEENNALPIIFSNFALGVGDGRYGQIPDYDKLYPLLRDALEQHNEVNAVMDLVLFRDAMEHVCRISRIITTGDALLVGVGGSGKQSLAKLAAYINSYEVFQITISSTYDIPDFRADLQQLYIKTGLKESPQCSYLQTLRLSTKSSVFILTIFSARGTFVVCFLPRRRKI